VIFVTIITQTGESKSTVPLKPISNFHDVIVKGAVAREGVYTISPEMTMGDLLAICEVCSNADLRRFKLDNPIKKGRVLHVRERKVIYVEVSGAISNPGIIEMYPGNRYADLKGKVALLSNADTSIFKKRGVLKDKQKIEIPFKSQKKGKPQASKQKNGVPAK
jgi:protein involved in polysaccharide export with SLBB domain